MRFIFSRPPIAVAFHYVAFSFAIFGFVLVLIRSDIRVLYIFLTIVGVFAALGFLIESIHTIYKVLGIVWARTVGKILYGGVALAVGLIATGIINHLVFEITNVEPENFSNFVKLATIPATVYLFFVALQMCIAAWAGIRYAVAMLTLAGGAIVSMFLPLFGVKNTNKFFTLIWRLISGNRSNFSSFKYVLLSTSHVIGAVAVLYVLALPGDIIRNHMKELHQITGMGLVEMEYYEGLPCTDSKEKTRFITLKDGGISIAQKGSSEYTFVKSKCATEDIPRSSK